MFVFGKNVCKDTLLSDNKIIKAYINDGFNDDEILQLIKNKRLEIKVLSKNNMDNLVRGLHQGIVLEIPNFEYNDIDELIENDNALLVILDHLEDPHNLGAIIRTCEAAGVDGIVIPKDRAIGVNSTVIKVSSGAINNMKIAQVTNIVNTMKYLKDRGYWIIGTDMNGEDYTTMDYKGKRAIVIGNEGSGLSKLVKDNCDFMATIPMKGKINSLNASVASAIFVFEAIKQRGN